MRGIWIGLLAAAALGLGLELAESKHAQAFPPSIEQPPELIDLPAATGLARLILPVRFAAADNALPVVVILPDALGDDGRAEPYGEALLSRGIAVFALDFDALAGRDAGGSPLLKATDWIARDTRLDPARIGLLGCGAGGRAALESGTGRPVVALYPGCQGLGLAEAGPALILYGTEAEDTGACAGLTAPSGVEMRPVPGAGHGWDVVGTLWLAAMTLPHPSGEGSVRAVPNPGATLEGAEMAAHHIEAALRTVRSAGR